MCTLQLKEVQDKYKSESENNSRLRKQHAELMVTSQRKEASLTEYTEKFATVQAMRDSLERDLVNFQTQLDQERTQKNHQADLVIQAESKVQALQAKVCSIECRKHIFRYEILKLLFNSVDKSNSDHVSIYFNFFHFEIFSTCSHVPALFS